MAENLALDERRKFTRFQNQDGAIVRLKHHLYAKFGLINNISRNGLAFRYLQDIDLEHSTSTDSYGTAYERADENPKLDIFFDIYGFFLPKVSCNIVEDMVFNDSRTKMLLPMKKCSVQFIELSQHQLAQLDHFIQNYTYPGGS